MSAIMFVEGGGDSKELHARCREGFSKLLDNCGYKGRKPRIVASGSRESTYGDFNTEHRKDKYDFVAMLVDSEDPVTDINRTWEHLKRRDRWDKPQNADSEQVLFMTTCMETWIVADREALKRHYGQHLQENALPPVVDLEGRNRQDIQNGLSRATRKCSNKYKKGKRSFAVLALIDPAELEKHLPSFARMKRILDAELR